SKVGPILVMVVSLLILSSVFTAQSAGANPGDGANSDEAEMLTLVPTESSDGKVNVGAVGKRVERGINDWIVTVDT
ncbi:unnamed protein product, partial [marine sediment metagenome]